MRKTQSAKVPRKNLPKPVDRAPRYLAAMALAIAITLAFFWFSNLPEETGEQPVSQEIRVSDTLVFAQETEVRLTELRDKLDTIEAVKGEVALEIDVLSSEIHKLDDKMEEIDADDVLSPAEMARIKKTVGELENRVESLNAPIS